MILVYDVYDVYDVCISFIFEAITLKRYPAQLSLTTWMSFLGAAQSAVFAACTEHKRAAWTIGFNIDLWSILYSGAVCSGLIYFIQLWCTVEKGPVFVTMFDPVATILVAILACFVLGERLYWQVILDFLLRYSFPEILSWKDCGSTPDSIVGAGIVILGLYLLLWGKEGDEVYITKSEESSDQTYEEKKIPRCTPLPQSRRMHYMINRENFDHSLGNNLETHIMNLNSRPIKPKTRNEVDKSQGAEEKQRQCELRSFYANNSLLLFSQNSSLFGSIYGIWTSFIQENVSRPCIQIQLPLP
ncbi:hypothetical protein ACLB2K_041218 [Fragaria x ananassa]